MTIGLFSGPVQILVIYFALVTLAYVESVGFQQQAPFLVLLPYLALAFCTLNLTMPQKKRYLTTAWLLFIAMSTYNLPTRRSIPQWASLTVSLGQTLYLLSFVDCVKRLWRTLILLLSLYYVSLFLYCFADLYSSIPVYVTLNSLCLLVDCGVVASSGSVYKFGSKKKTYSNQAAPIRFIGALFSLLVSSVILINGFAYRIHGYSHWIILLKYIAHSLMFLANEMAF